MSVSTYTPGADRIVHTTKVDFVSRNIETPIHVVQYDNTLPVVEVSLYKNGQVYAVPSSITHVNIRCSRPDGGKIYNPILGTSSDRAKLYFEITQVMAMKDGQVKIVIEFVNNANVVSSSHIFLSVDRNPVQENDIQVSDEFKALSEYVDDTLNAKNQAQTAATNAANSASSAATSATSAANSASSANSSKNAAATSASNAATSASAAQTSATNAASSASAAQASASSASTSAGNASNSAAKAATSESNAKTSENNAGQVATDILGYVSRAEAAADKAMQVLGLAEALSFETSLNFANLASMFEVLEDYKITDYLLDSNGNKILDSDGVAIVTTYLGFEALFITIQRLVTNDAIQDTNISLLFEEIEKLKKVNSYTPVYEELLDSSGSNILDSAGSTILARMMQAIK